MQISASSDIEPWYTLLDSYSSFTLSPIVSGSAFSFYQRSFAPNIERITKEERTVNLRRRKYLENETRRGAESDIKL